MERVELFTVIRHRTDTLLDGGLRRISQHRSRTQGRGKVPFRCADSQTNVGQGLARVSVLQDVINPYKAASYLLVVPETAYFAVVGSG